MTYRSACVHEGNIHHAPLHLARSVVVLTTRYSLLAVQAGNYITEELVTTVVTMIAQADELHAYVTQRLFVAIQDDIGKVCAALVNARWISCACIPLP